MTIRREDLRKLPGVAESLDWAAALLGLGVRQAATSLETLYETLSCLLKTEADHARIDRATLARLLAKVA